MRVRAQAMVVGRRWRTLAWVCAGLCVLMAAAWGWSGWRYVWIGGPSGGVVLDEGQAYVVARAESLQRLDFRDLYGMLWERDRYAFAQSDEALRCKGMRWRWSGRTGLLEVFDEAGGPFVRVSCPLWALSLGFGATSGTSVWMARRRRRPGRCARCGYDVSGLGVCPECGTVRTTSA